MANRVSSIDSQQFSPLREGRTDTIPRKNYVLGVLSCTSTETNWKHSSQRGQSNLALRNAGRHASEGYDLCSNTHCQQYSNDTSRVRDQLRRAVDETAGELETEKTGEPIDAYFHAACGGATTSIEALWGVPAPSYLRGVRDELPGIPGRDWTDEIPATLLMNALITDPR